MDPRLALTVAVVVLAGCGAAPFAGSGTPTAAETLTPAPVSTPDGADRTPVERPPGVSPGEMVDARRLREAHESAVAGRSYRWTLDYEVERSGEPDSFQQGFTRRAVVEPDRFLVRQVDHGAPLNQSLFVNETGGYLRTVRGNVTRSQTLVRPGSTEDYVASGQIVERFLSGMDPNVTRIEREGRTYYRLHDRTGVPPTLERRGRSVRDYSVTAYVTPEGFVRSLTVSYERFREMRTERVFVRFFYEAVGTATVERPAWVEDLSLATPTPTPPPLRDTGTTTPANESDAGTATPSTAPTASPTLTTAENAT